MYKWCICGDTITVIVVYIYIYIYTYLYVYMVWYIGRQVGMYFIYGILKNNMENYVKIRYENGKR